MQRHEHPGEAGIVYCLSRNSVEKTAEFLTVMDDRPFIPSDVVSLAQWTAAANRGEDLNTLADPAGRRKFSQVKLLFLLEDGREHSVKEIATHLGLSLPAASRAVDGLIQRDVVTRRESVEDRRSRLIALSDHGREVVERMLRARFHTLDLFVAGITPGLLRVSIGLEDPNDLVRDFHQALRPAP